MTHTSVLKEIVFDPPFERTSSDYLRYDFARVEVFDFVFDFSVCGDVWDAKQFDNHWQASEASFKERKFPYLTILNLSHDDWEHSGTLSRWLYVDGKDSACSVYYGEAWNMGWRAYTGDDLSYDSILLESMRTPKISDGLLTLVARKDLKEI